MRFRKIYLEISNICNLRCSFCHGTRRAPRTMTAEEFSSVLEKIRPYTDYLYFHLMGEPLCHPNLRELLGIAESFGFRVIITTNGVLLPKTKELLLSSASLHKINISLHAFEANDLPLPFSDYLEGCLDFGKSAARSDNKKIVVYRLWNKGGKDARNGEILEAIREKFGDHDETYNARRGITLDTGVYLEYGNKFDWPDLSAPDMGEEVFCYGLRDQLGILCDGTVVPCCLDSEGDIALGNIFESSMDDILSSARARALFDGFSNRRATEELCRRCGYAQRFKQTK